MSALFYRKTKCFFVFLLVVTLCSIIPIWRSSSRADGELENGLKDLFSRELGHTLLGAKPVSSEDWFWYRSMTSQSKENVVNFLKQHFAGSKTFILYISAPHPCFLDITIIHKPLFLKTIQKEKYLKDFLKRNYKTVDGFFQALQSSKGGIFEKLHFDDCALGLAFGYGRTNSFYASRRMEIQHFFRYGKGFCGYIMSPMPSPESVVRFCKLPLPWIDLPKYGIKTSAGFHSLEEELDYLKSQEYEVQTFDPPYLFVPPCFIAKRCEETNKLINHYKKSTEKLARIYLKKPFSQFLIEQCAKS